jgi:hypothetical protein
VSTPAPPTSPRLAVSPAPQVTTSSSLPFIDSSAPPQPGRSLYATSTNTNPAIPNDSASPAPRLPNSSPHRLIGTLSNEAALPQHRPEPPHPRVPSTHPPICAKSPERYRAAAHQWWGRAGSVLV